MSKVTFWLSARPVRPARSTAEMWTNTSLPPPSGAMKPKPLVVLNHFTVPVAMCPELLLYAARGSAAARLVVVQDRVTEPIEGQVVDSRNVSECNMGRGTAKRKGYRAGPARSQNGHHGADGHALVQVLHMGIDHADAAIGDRPSDGGGLIGAVDAVIGVAPVLEQVERARAERVFGSAGLYIAVAAKARIGLRVARDHLVGGPPRGPFPLDVDGGRAAEFQPRAPDADAVAARLAGGGDEIEEMRPRHHDQPSRRIPGREGHLLRREFRVDLRGSGRGGRQRGRGQRGEARYDEGTAVDHVIFPTCRAGPSIWARAPGD